MTNSRDFNHSEAHTILKNKILAEIGVRQDFLVIPTVSGVFRSLYGNRVIHAGSDKADIIGIVYPKGRGVAIEVKTGKAVLAPNQKRWKIAFESRGGIYRTARSVEDAVLAIEEAKKQ